MSDYPMLISNKLHSFRNFRLQRYNKIAHDKLICASIFITAFNLIET